MNSIVSLGLGLGGGDSDMTLLVGGLLDDSPTVQTISLAFLVVLNPTTIRVVFTIPPKATLSTDANDGLNPSNWIITGPSSETVVSVSSVIGVLTELDITLANPLRPGRWTVTVRNIVSSTLATLAPPTSLYFNFLATGVFPDINGGAVNNSNCDILRKFLNPAIKGNNVDGILAGLCYGDSIRTQIANSAFDQLFIPSASGIYLDRRVSNIGITRPSGVGMADEALRNLAIVIDNQKLTREAILETLEVYYGQDTVKASAIATSDEPYPLVDQDTLNVVFNNNENITFLFDARSFTDISNATAIEVATTINNQLINLGSKARATTSLDTVTGTDRLVLFSGKRGMASSVQIVGGRAQDAFNFSLPLFIDMGGSPYQTWDITLSPTMVGDLVFTITSNVKYDFNQLLNGDIVYIYGNEFMASGNIGSFVISNINISYSGSSLTQSFEITNPLGTANSSLPQINFQSLRFFRPLKNTLNSQLRKVIVNKAKDGLDIIIPATTQIVSRTPSSGAYGKIGEAVEIISLIRGVSSTVTGISVSPHGFTIGEFITIDGAFPQQTLPAVVAGVPSGAFSGGVASGITNASLSTTVSNSNTINKIRHKAVSIPNNILMAVGGEVQQDVSGTPIVSSNNACVLSVTSKTTLADGSLKENYQWQQLAHALTIGNYGFGATALADGRVVETGGFNGTNLMSAPFTPVNNYDVLSYNPTITQDTMVSGTLPAAVAEHAQCSLSNGNAIITGGWQTQLSWNMPTNLGYLFTATSNTWSTIANMNKARMNHEMVSLANGKVLAMGARVPFRRITNTEDPGTIAYYALDTAGSSPDLINGNNITIGGSDTVSGKGRAGNSFLPGASPSSVTTAGTPQTNLNSALLGEWAAECWVLAGATGAFMSNGQAGGSSANNCLLSFGVAKYTSPNANDGKFFWRWENGTHVEVSGFSTVPASTFLPTFEGSDQGIWHHIALTKSLAISGAGGEYDVALYVDGVLIQTWFNIANATNGSTGLFYLAKDPTLSTMTSLNTRIDEIRLISAARNSYDIQNHYSEQCGYTLYDSMDYWAFNYQVGKCLKSCEIYDPTGNTWTNTGSMAYSKTAFGAIALPDGRVITIGGYGYNPTQGNVAVPLNICEIYDPGAGLWSMGPVMPNAREFPVCVLLNSQIWVMGGRGVNSIDILDINTMTWKTSIAPEGLAPYRAVGGLVDSQTIATCGGAILTNATHLYSGSHLADLTSPLGSLIIPGIGKTMAGRMNGTYKVSAVPNGTTFQYNTLESGYSQSIIAGVTATKVGADFAPVGIPGPFTYNTKTGVSVTAFNTTLSQVLNQDQQYSLITLGSTIGIPKGPGYLIFDLGYSTQTGPVKYLTVISPTQILIDPTFRFSNTLPIGTKVRLLKDRLPFQPDIDEEPGNFYITPSSSGRIAAQGALQDITAAGLDINVTVVYPKDTGLGGSGCPTHGNYKLSDIVTDFAGDQIDTELATARDE